MAKSAAMKGFKSVHAKSIKALAWVSMVIATADGVLLAGTFVAKWIHTGLKLIPEPWRTIVVVIVIIGGLVAAFLDCWLDLEPNQVAIWAALLLPSIAKNVSGGVAQWVQDVSTTVLHAIDQWLFKAAPAGLGSSSLAIAFAVGALLMANRVVKKSRKG